MAIQDKKKGTTPEERQAQIDAANKRTAAKIAKKRAEAAAKKRPGVKKSGGVYVPGLSVDKPKAKKGGAAYIPGTGVVGDIAKSKFIAEHTVKKGDTLSAIAKKYYGSGSRPYYELIQKANPDLIKDVNLIYPDQVFKIPALPPELKK